jgi:hypothetical protein
MVAIPTHKKAMISNEYFMTGDLTAFSNEGEASFADQ